MWINLVPWSLSTVKHDYWHPLCSHWPPVPLPKQPPMVAYPHHKYEVYWGPVAISQPLHTHWWGRGVVGSWATHLEVWCPLLPSLALECLAINIRNDNFICSSCLWLQKDFSMRFAVSLGLTQDARRPRYTVLSDLKLKINFLGYLRYLTQSWACVFLLQPPTVRRILSYV